MPLTALQQSLLVLAALKNQIEPALKVFKKYIKDDDLRFTVTNHLLILVASFLQEWQKLEGLGSDPSVKCTLHAASPAVKRIRQWKGLFRLRSSALAHGFRNKDDSLVNFRKLFKEMQAPSAYAEQLLLGECAVYAIAIAICQQHADYAAALSIIYSTPQHFAEVGIQSMAEFESAVYEVRTAILAIDPALEQCFSGRVVRAAA